MANDQNVSYTTGETGGRQTETPHPAKLAASARQSWEDIEQRMDLRGHIDRHPFRAAAIALGAGYLLGGGLFTRFTARLLVGGVRLGLRMAALPVIRDEIGQLAGSFSGQTIREDS